MQRSPIKPVESSVRRRPRRGMLLMEVVAVMGASAVLVAAAISILMAASHADRQFARRLDASQTTASTLDRLREEIHAARALRWDDEQRTLILSAANGARVEYRQHANRLERWVIEPDDAAEQGSLSTVLRLPARTHIAVEPASAAAGELVHITLRIDSTEPRPDRDPPPDAEIVVTVGRDARLLHE